LNLEDAEGDYELIFLIRNMETLLDAAHDALGESRFGGKPNPDQRDRVLHRIAWGSPQDRQRVRDACPSFDRLVVRVARALLNPISSR
jgi:hypothetical protein